MQTAIQVEGVSAHEVKFAVEREVTLVDVRVPSEFAKAHIPGAKNVPIYQSIRGAQYHTASSADVVTEPARHPCTRHIMP